MAHKKFTSQKSVVDDSEDSSSEQEIEQELEEELVVESDKEFEEESKKELADKEQWQAATLANLKARKQEHDNKKHASTAASASTSNKQSKVVNLESARTKMKLPLQCNQALPSKDHHPNSSVSWRNQWDSQYQASKSLPDKSVQQTQSLSDGNKKPPATEQLTERGKLLANVCLSTKKMMRKGLENCQVVFGETIIGGKILKKCGGKYLNHQQFNTSLFLKRKVYTKMVE